MNKKLAFTIFLTLLMFAITPVGCAGTDKDVISGKGTIEFINLEGGFYGIVGDDAKNYDPLNLSQEFQVDGLRISFQVKERKDVDTFHMWGIPVEIIEIEKLK